MIILLIFNSILICLTDIYSISLINNFYFHLVKYSDLYFVNLSNPILQNIIILID